MNRRGFLGTLTAAAVGPWVITKTGVLMPVRKLASPVLHNRRLWLGPAAMMFYPAKDGYYIINAQVNGAKGIELRQNGVVLASSDGDRLSMVVHAKAGGPFASDLFAVSGEAPIIAWARIA